MSSLSRNSPVDQVDSRGLCSDDWIAGAFECYQIPSDLGQEVIDPLDEHTVHSCQSCYLGPAYLKFDALPLVKSTFTK
ncbi:hypothetical protein BCR42DRAFT_439721 [Absidia repens]|uniref:Uncharacterized protein n=1 Tax=Absidia repens TaxID=90262 RepID=A0A1X2IBW1_9FUNG|nr:hypothetical protein BCR42DRAFT_439721 [Absidia repens]